LLEVSISKKSRAISSWLLATRWPKAYSCRLNGNCYLHHTPPSPPVLHRSLVDQTHLDYQRITYLIIAIPQIRLHGSAIHRQLRAWLTHLWSPRGSFNLRRTTIDTEGAQAASGSVCGGSGKSEEGAECIGIQSLPENSGVTTAR